MIPAGSLFQPAALFVTGSTINPALQPVTMRHAQKREAERLLTARPRLNGSMALLLRQVFHGDSTWKI
jgi:hypothetical protein